MTARRRWVYVNGAAHEVDLEYTGVSRGGSDSGILIIPDIAPFVSPVDGTEITGRRALREHNKLHSVTNIEDFKGVWAKAAEERKSRMDGTFQAPSIRENLIKALNRRS